MRSCQGRRLQERSACHTTRMTLHSDEQRREPFLSFIHCPASLQSHKTVSTNRNLFEDKGELSRSRESNRRRPLTSLTSYRWAKPAHESQLSKVLSFHPGAAPSIIYLQVCLPRNMMLGLLPGILPRQFHSATFSLQFSSCQHKAACHKQ